MSSQEIDPYIKISGFHHNIQGYLPVPVTEQLPSTNLTYPSPNFTFPRNYAVGPALQKNLPSYTPPPYNPNFVISDGVTPEPTGSSYSPDISRTTRGAISAIESLKAPLNASFAPNSVKEIGSYSTDRLTNALTIKRVVSYVKDITNVAHLVESYGYLINAFIYNVKLTELPHNRVYFDVFKIKNCSVTGVPSITVRERISERLSNGIRFWHTMLDAPEIKPIIVKDGYPIGSLSVLDNADYE